MIVLLKLFLFRMVSLLFAVSALPVPLRVPLTVDPVLLTKLFVFLKLLVPHNVLRMVLPVLLTVVCWTVVIVARLLVFVKLLLYHPQPPSAA